MSIKKLHFAFALFVSLFFNTYAQESPSLISQGRYVGKTIPLIDFAQSQERQYKINEITIIPII